MKMGKRFCVEFPEELGGMTIRLLYDTSQALSSSILTCIREDTGEY